MFCSTTISLQILFETSFSSLVFWGKESMQPIALWLSHSNWFLRLLSKCLQFSVSFEVWLRCRSFDSFLPLLFVLSLRELVNVDESLLLRIHVAGDDLVDCVHYLCASHDQTTHFALGSLDFDAKSICVCGNRSYPVPHLFRFDLHPEVDSEAKVYSRCL